MMGVHCKIVLDNKVIYAGGTLSGRVIYHFDSKESFEAIKLHFRGKAHFSYQEDKDTVHVEEKFLTDEYTIYGERNLSQIMAPGTYSYNFKYVVFSSYPSSYTYYGNQTPSEIKYTIKTKRHTSFMVHSDAVEEFFVVKYIDLNNVPEANEHSEFNISKDTFWLCCTSRPFFVNANLERKGFIPGKTIPLIIECDNQSTYPAEELIIYLRLVINFYNCKLNKSSNRRLCGRPPASITLSEISFGPIDGYEVRTWKRAMEIPRIQPLNTEGCKILNIHYGLYFKVRFQFPHRDLTGEIPITLGNVPFGDNPDLSQSDKLLIINDLKELKKFKILQKFNYV